MSLRERRGELLTVVDFHMGCVCSEEEEILHGGWWPQNGGEGPFPSFFQNVEESGDFSKRY